jgi:tryptophanyl-tRNA synthetase
MIDTIVSGIRASGKLHIGNYLGALKQFVELQDKHAGNCYFFIADLHALTTPFEPQTLSQNTLEVAADYLAAGIDPSKATFFLQSQILEHAELAWIFNCLTPLGELQRMTQFKDKSSQNKEAINGGLLTYPTLMAADILIYKPTAVPVGDDQTQHVELTRDIARKFNNRFGETFPEPKTYLRKPLRIMSLSDPAKKMSKTGDEALMLDDTPAEIKRKLAKAVTATEGKQKSPGVDNLFLLLEHFGTPEQVEFFNEQRKDNTIKFSQLKDMLAADITMYFKEFREKKQKLMSNQDEMLEILTAGAIKARCLAQQTLSEVKEKIGLL